MGGWPVAGLTEIMIPGSGIGELRLLTPVLRRLTQAGRTIALLVPPYLSYAPTLIQHGVDLKHVRVVRSATALEGLASIEAGLQSANFAAIVAWMPLAAAQDANAIRMLQLAARLSHCPAFLFSTGHPLASTPEAHTLSGAQLHLQIKSAPGDTLRLQRLDAQHPHGLSPVTLSLPAPIARVRTVQSPPTSGIAQAVQANHRAPQAAMGPRLNLRNSLANFAAALSAIREPMPGAVSIAVTASNEGAPARTSWPFKQRRRTPETPIPPTPVRLRRAN
jgi:protein ImuA